MSTLEPSIPLTNPQFKYVNSAQTDIRETFKRFNALGGQDSLKPLVPILYPNGFVLSADWFQIED